MKDKTFLNVAYMIARESKCVKLKVGAVLVRDKHILSTGYNGTVKGVPNCCEVYEAGGFKYEEHSEWSQKNEIHAEMNALLYCPVDTKGATLYCTHCPCYNCMKHLVAAGVSRIVYSEKYSSSCALEVKEFCDVAGVKFEQIKVS